MKKVEVKVVLTLTDGYQQRFTEACLKQIAKRDNKLPEEPRKEKTA
ncbi:MAG: hypothetical protein MSR29_12055 [Lachnospiraceae bacterium]|nr:hypothetical protein [Lachnospiraceae bacterium]